MVFKVFALVVQGNRTDEAPTVHVLPYATTPRQAAGEAWQNYLDEEPLAWEEDGEGQWTDGERRWAHVVEVAWDSN